MSDVWPVTVNTTLLEIWLGAGEVKLNVGGITSVKLATSDSDGCMVNPKVGS